MADNRQFRLASFTPAQYTPVEFDAAAYANQLARMDENHFKALEYQTNIAKAINELPLNEKENDFKVKLANEINTGIEEHVDESGYYGNALSYAIQSARDLLIDPRVIGRIDAQKKYKEYETYINTLVTSGKLDQDTADRFLEENPYSVVDKYEGETDETAKVNRLLGITPEGKKVVGVTSDTYSKPLQNIDYNAVLDEAKKRVAIRKGKTETIHYIKGYDANGNPIYTANVNEASDREHAYYKTGNQYEQISKKDLYDSINQMLADNNLRASLEQQHATARWKHMKNLKSSNGAKIVDSYTDDLGNELDFDSWLKRRNDLFVSSASYYNQSSTVDAIHWPTNSGASDDGSGLSGLSTYLRYLPSKGGSQVLFKGFSHAQLTSEKNNLDGKIKELINTYGLDVLDKDGHIRADIDNNGIISKAKEKILNNPALNDVEKANRLEDIVTLEQSYSLINKSLENIEKAIGTDDASKQILGLVSLVEGKNSDDTQKDNLLVKAYNEYFDNMMTGNNGKKADGIMITFEPEEISRQTHILLQNYINGLDSSGARFKNAGYKMSGNNIIIPASAKYDIPQIMKWLINSHNSDLGAWFDSTVGFEAVDKDGNIYDKEGFGTSFPSANGVGAVPGFWNTVGSGFAWLWNEATDKFQWGDAMARSMYQLYHVYDYSTWAYDKKINDAKVMDFAEQEVEYGVPDIITILAKANQGKWSDRASAERDINSQIESLIVNNPNLVNNKVLAAVGNGIKQEVQYDTKTKENLSSLITLLNAKKAVNISCVTAGGDVGTQITVSYQPTSNDEGIIALAKNIEFNDTPIYDNNVINFNITIPGFINSEVTKEIQNSSTYLADKKVNLLRRQGINEISLNEEGDKIYFNSAGDAVAIYKDGTTQAIKYSDAIKYIALGDTDRTIKSILQNYSLSELNSTPEGQNTIKALFSNYADHIARVNGINLNDPNINFNDAQYKLMQIFVSQYLGK